MEKFSLLKQKFGTHKKAAEYLGVSYRRYCEWKQDVSKMPKYAKKLIELAVDHQCAHITNNE